jgi:hypothetical protein
MSLLGGSPNLLNYWALTLPEHQNYTGVVLTLLTNPFYVFKHVFFNTDKLIYLLQIFLPVLFLPLFSGKRLILLVPGFMIILLSEDSVQFSIGFHYSAHIIAPVFYLTIYGIVWVRERWPSVSHAAVALPLLLAGLSMNHEFGLILSKRFPGFFTPDERERIAYTMFRKIPADASVAAISRYYTHLSAREEAVLLGRMRKRADFIVADLYPSKPASDPYELIYRGHSLKAGEVKQIILHLLNTPHYGVVDYDQGIILLQSGKSVGRNQEVRRMISELTYESSEELIPYYQDPAENVIERRYSQSDLFLEFLGQHNTQTIVIVGHGDINANLSYIAKLFLIYRGSNIIPLRNGSSYIAILRGTEMMYEQIERDSPITVSSGSAEILRELFPGRTVSLRSTGSTGTRRSQSPSARATSVNIDGIEYSLDKEGINVVVFDRSLNVTAQAAFDTGR